jgi:hypothetical protein
MPSSNAPIRHQAGGVLKITDGTTEYTFVALEPGSVEIEDGGYEPLAYLDRDELQDPFEGNERASRFKCTIKFSGGSNAGDMLKHLTQRDTSTGKMKLYTITVDFPDYKGAATGDRATCAKCYIPTPPKIKTGERFDMLEIEMLSSEPKFTWAAY